MKKSLIIIVLFLSSISGVYAQTDGKLVLKENVPSILSEQTDKNDISAKDWSEMEAALQVEDWNKTIALSEEYLQKLDAETKDLKKARLRYIYLYSLAGKVISYSFSGDREQEEYARKRLEVAAKSYVGREFVMPVRKVLADCKDAVNYVCDSKENPGFLHIAATNPTGTSVLFSEYIELSRVKLDVRKHSNADVILGGILKGVRLNPEKSNKLVMTLQFGEGYVQRIYTNGS